MRRDIAVLLAIFGFFVCLTPAPSTACDASDAAITITLSREFARRSHTGRLFLMISRSNDPEVRLQDYWFRSSQFLGVDVSNWSGERAVTIDGAALGYPFDCLGVLAPGEYSMQAALLNYRRYPRADGHVIWAPDQWTGSSFLRAPGTLFSEVKRLSIADDTHVRQQLVLSGVVAEDPTPEDTQWVKHVRIQSVLLSRFWGRPIYLGATLLLPQGYDANSARRYPVIFQQQVHFNQDPPFGFSTGECIETERQSALRLSRGLETGCEFADAWMSHDFPRVVAVALQHPTPFGDVSAATNSANNGPYEDAILRELIPHLERRFQIAVRSEARFLVGSGAGGRDALSLMLHHPDAFAGAWIFSPWPFAFDRYFGIDLYQADNVFVSTVHTPPRSDGAAGWANADRPFGRTLDGFPSVSVRQMSRHDQVVGGALPGGEFGADAAILGPIGADGFARPPWNASTGEIDSEVVRYWREHHDLALYTRDNWQTLAPQLRGKLHLYAGDNDEFYKNLSLYAYETVLASLPGGGDVADFHYGRRAGHGWQGMSNAALVREIAAAAARNVDGD